MKLPTCTIDDIMSHNPCDEYPRERIASLLATIRPRRKRFNGLHLAQLDIPVADYIWVLRACLSDRDLRLLACDFAEWAVKKHWTPKYPDDKRPQDAIAAARMYAMNPTDENKAKMDASSSAAWSAAWSAARSAAWSAAESAAWSAAGAAAWSVAESAERARQKQHIIKYLKRLEARHD